MRKPTPVAIDFRKLDIYQYDLSELEQIKPEYFKFSLPVDLKDPYVDETLTKYYTVVFKGILSEKIEEIDSRIKDIISYINGKYKFLRLKIMRKYADEIKRLNAVFGIANHYGMSGEYQKKLQELHIAEYEEEREIYMKMLEEYNGTLERYMGNFIDTVAEANQLYRDIFERDFRITLGTYRQIFENAILKYNDEIIRYRALLEVGEVYREIFRELVEIERRKFEAIELILRRKELTEEQKIAINEYISAYQRYLVEFERLLYLEYEEFELIVRRYEAELRKFRTRIEQVNSLVEFINNNIAMYRSLLDIEESKLRINDARLDATMATIRAYREKIEAKEQEIRAKISEARAQVEEYEAQIVRYEGEIRKYSTEVESVITEYEKQMYEVIMKLEEEEKKIVDYLKTELEVRENYLKALIDVVFENRKIGIIDNYLSRIVGEKLQVAKNIVMDYNRTMAMAYSSITAQIVREMR